MYKNIHSQSLKLLQISILVFLPWLIIAQVDIERIELQIEKKQYSEAQNALELHLKKSPNDLKAIELLGDAFGHQGNWFDAVDTYKRLVESNENDANYQYKYGGAMGMKALKVNKLRALSLLDDIKQALLRAEQLDHMHIGAKWGLIELYIQLPGLLGGSKVKAMEYAKSLESVSKIDGFLAQGYIFEYFKEFDAAEVYYRKAMDECVKIKWNDPTKKPNSNTKLKLHKGSRIYYHIGKIAADYNTELERGLLFINQYIKDYSAGDGIPLEWAYLKKAKIYENLQLKEDAIKWVDKSLQTKPDFKEALTTKARILNM